MMDVQRFFTGAEFDAGEYLGAHPYSGGTRFALWAPSAREARCSASRSVPLSWPWVCS